MAAMLKFNMVELNKLRILICCQILQIEVDKQAVSAGTHRTVSKSIKIVYSSSSVITYNHCNS